MNETNLIPNKMKTKGIMTIITMIEMLVGFFLGLVGVIDKDTTMVVISCMFLICGKIDSNDIFNPK